MTDNPLLLPAPHHLVRQDGTFTLPDEKLIVLDAADAQALRFSAEQLQISLQDRAAVSWDVVAGTAACAWHPVPIRRPWGSETICVPEN